MNIDTWSSLNQQEKDILLECDEITLDFTSFSRDSILSVAPECVVIGYGQLCDEFLNLLIHTEHGQKLQVSHLLPQDFVSLKGSLGNFKLSFLNGDKSIQSIVVSQVISFAPLENLPTCKGVHRADMYCSADEMLGRILSFCGEIECVRNIVFDPTHCQYQGRRPLANGSGICHACADICPTIGITKDDSVMLLELSSIDCIACGKCVSVCPTGSVQREGDGLESFTYRARLYKGYIPLIVARGQVQELEDMFKSLKAQNPALLPFILEVPDMLNATYLLTLLQEAGAQVVLYTPLGEHILADIESLNETYRRIFGKKAILHYTELSQLAPLPHTHYIYTPKDSECAKDIFAERMRFWVKQEDYGRLSIKHFGILNIKPEQCTLCLSCVEACNTKALMNNQARFELLYKPSLCTDCGYCVASCPEFCISLHSHALDLKPQSFEYTPMASDEPFKCIECGEIFATSKSIAKIKTILSPAFKDDNLKLKTLECCANCKVKVMFEGAYS